MFAFIKRLFRRNSPALLGNDLRKRLRSGLQPALLEELEQRFVQADLGVQTSHKLIERISYLHRKGDKLSWDQLRGTVEEEIEALLGGAKELSLQSSGPTVVFVIGVNGNGKTTTIAKLAHHFQKQGKRVLLGGADTFRAAAGDQLAKWGDKLHIDVVKQQRGGDPAAVVHDALTAARAREIDIVLVDTAGRLHNKKELMGELEKMRRVAGRVIEGAPHQTLLAMDATTGQNGLEQARTFHQSVPISGLVLTKMDGTAKGGIAVAVQRELGLPVYYIGVGEKIEDLKPFQPREYARTLVEG